MFHILHFDVLNTTIKENSFVYKLKFKILKILNKKIVGTFLGLRHTYITNWALNYLVYQNLYHGSHCLSLIKPVCLVKG